MWSSNPIPGYLSKIIEIWSQKDICNPVFIGAFTHKIQAVGISLMSISRWMDKEKVNTMKYYSTLLKKKVLPYVAIFEVSQT